MTETAKRFINATNGRSNGRVMSGDGTSLRRGWTTGACAAAATKAAYTALLNGVFPDPVTVTLPGGARPAFALAERSLSEGAARAGVIKDAGDDPDVTHLALVRATVRPGRPGCGVTFRAGEGVGTVTRPGLPVPPGEPAINPAPRAMIRAAVVEVGGSGDVEVEISIPGGAGLAERTLNPRLGIVGGLSILGTTGVVVPYSCSAWIETIRVAVTAARAAGETRLVAATGKTSEIAARRELRLSDAAMIDMGDFAGGLFACLRETPVERLTLVGGFGKLTKLAQGCLDLHSGRSSLDFPWLAERVRELGAEDLAVEVPAAATAQWVLDAAAARELPLADRVAEFARRVAVAEAGLPVDMLIIDRAGNVVGRAVTS